jgi:D-glycero-D-manno-heptose 1,7-bisphosphate phosphatase
VYIATPRGQRFPWFEWFDGRSYAGRPAAFLDRDGVLNAHIAGGYVLARAEFRWLPGATDALRRLTDAGRVLIVVSNQSCVNRGLLAADELEAIMAAMVADLAAADVPCAAWLSCPHRPDEGCACRKPGTAMIERAAEMTGAALDRSILIGDSPSDMAAAQRVGMRGLMVERNAPYDFAAAVERLMLEAV